MTNTGWFFYFSQSQDRQGIFRYSFEGKLTKSQLLVESLIILNYIAEAVAQSKNI
jgi:hypothetical protein